MALEVTFFFPSFLSLNLCMSLWFHCSHTAVQRQSYTKRWNEKAVWGDIESQVNSTARHEHWTQMFSTLLNSSSVSRCCGKWRRGDGESEPRYRTVPSQSSGADRGVIMCYNRRAGTSPRWSDFYLWTRWESCELTEVQLIALVFTSAEFD